MEDGEILGRYDFCPTDKEIGFVHLDSFAKLRKARLLTPSCLCLSSCLSVCPSAWNSSDLTEYFSKICRENSIRINA